MDLPLEREREIKALVAKLPGVAIEDSTVIVSTTYIHEVAILVFELVGSIRPHKPVLTGGTASA